MAHKLSAYYRYHSKIYDLTRWSFLFGRSQLLNSLPDLDNDAVIIDIGCGTGYHLPELARKYPQASIIGMDLSADMLEKASIKCAGYNNVKLINEAYDEHSFVPDSVDLVICSYSLSMIDDPAPILNGIERHLKDTGIVAVIDFKQTRYTWFERWMHVNHVDFNTSLFSQLQERFKPIHFTEKNAYSSLWNFGLFVGMNGSENMRK